MWTYSGNPASSPKDQVRFLVGDTDETDQLLQDEEIEWLISDRGSALAAAVAAAEAIAAKFARQVDKAVGDLRLSLSQKAQGYAARAAELRLRLATGAAPYAGGISASDKEAQELDTDRVPPAFRVGMHDYVAEGEEDA